MLPAAVAGGSALLPQGVLANAFQDPVVNAVEERGSWSAVKRSPVVAARYDELTGDRR
jgi:hypothetical protein